MSKVAVVYAALKDASVRHELIDPLAERGIEKQHCVVASERVDEVAKDAFDRRLHSSNPSLRN